MGTSGRMTYVLKIGLLLALVIAVVLSIPLLFSLSFGQERTYSPSGFGNEFPVTVDPTNKKIVEDERVNALLAAPDSPLTAAAADASDALNRLFSWIAEAISYAPWYEALASVEGRIVTVTPGMRKEQVAMTFAKALSWDEAQKKQFLTTSASSSLPLIEGSYSPGVYLVRTPMTPREAQALVNERFEEEILSHYGPATAAIVPLPDALIIASLIQRETIGTKDMRLVSGIIWNRLFKGMKLQVDATLQYAKANTASATSWWPKVIPADARRRSPYNTYLNPGLPPAPIANPSVAAVLAALNPIETPCLFYFNDEEGNILCTNTYPEHVALLKQYYGRGK